MVIPPTPFSIHGIGKWPKNDNCRPKKMDFFLAILGSPPLRTNSALRFCKGSITDCTRLLFSGWSLLWKAAQQARHSAILQQLKWTLILQCHLFGGVILISKHNCQFEIIQAVNAFFTSCYMKSEHLKGCSKPWFLEWVAGWVGDDNFCKELLSLYTPFGPDMH